MYQHCDFRDLRSDVRGGASAKVLGFSAACASSDRSRTAGDQQLKVFGRFAVGSLCPGKDPARQVKDLANRLPACEVLLLLCHGDTHAATSSLPITAHAASILCLDLARTAAIAFDEAPTALVVPRSLIRLGPATLEAAHGAHIQADLPLGRLFAKQLALLADAAPELGRRDGDALSESVSALATAILGAATPAKADEATDLPLASILAFIERNLAEPDLSPALIARRFGLSRSALYRLFEPMGGIAACIRERRLARVTRHIAAAGGEGRGSVARLASAAGFPSEAALTRAFRRRYGMAPSAALAGARPLHAPIDGPPSRWRRLWLDNSRIEEQPIPGTAGPLR